MNGKKRYEYLQMKSREYMMLRDIWKTEYKKPNLTEELKFVTSMVNKDVIRTDRTHPFFKGREDNKNIESLFDLLCTFSINHPDVSYCQGMSDMASVLLVVQNDEANAYLCFCSLMKRLKHNFLFDGKAMTCKFNHLKLLLSHYDHEFWTYMIEHEVNDLFFTYRWLLLELKREFAFDDALYMLEVMWSRLPAEINPNGTVLSDIYHLSADGSSVQPVHKALSAVLSTRSASLGTSGTPNPYSKLHSLCRKHSGQPQSSERTKMTPVKAIQQDIANSSSSSRLHNLTSRLKSEGDLHYTDTDLSENTITGVLSTSEPASTFYLGVKEDECGILRYTEECPDDCFEAIESLTSSQSNENISCSSADSGIRTHPATPLSMRTSHSELQFAFELSGGHKNPTQQSVFPPPDEFGFGNPFLMFAAYTMILQHRDHIIKNKLDFDSIVMLFDRKVRKNDVHKILYRTKEVYDEYIRLDRQTYDC